MALKPLRDRVVVKRSKAEEKTASGLIIPTNAQEKMSEGVVIAVGSGRCSAESVSSCTVIPMEVKIGDKVIFGKFAGVDVTVDGEDCTILGEEEILAVVE